MTETSPSPITDRSHWMHSEGAAYVSRSRRLLRVRRGQTVRSVLDPFGLRPKRGGVTITHGSQVQSDFRIRQDRTPLSKIDRAHVTRNCRCWTAVGARTSFVDDGFTFGTNCAAGVCVHFCDPVVCRLRRKGHSALTVTVADLDGLAARPDGTRPYSGRPNRSGSEATQLLVLVGLARTPNATRPSPCSLIVKHAKFVLLTAKPRCGACRWKAHSSRKRP
jgi:hypothetical protein